MPKSKLPKSILPDPWSGKPPAPSHAGKRMQPKGSGVDRGLGHPGSAPNRPTGSSVGNPGTFTPGRVPPAGIDTKAR